MEEKIVVVRIRPAASAADTGERITCETIANTLQGLQKAVDGHLEAFHPVLDGMDWLCNENGKIIPLAPNFAVLGGYGQVRDIVHGTVIVCRHDADGECASVTPLDYLRIKDYFAEGTKVRLCWPEP